MKRDCEHCFAVFQTLFSQKKTCTILADKLKTRQMWRVIKAKHMFWCTFISAMKSSVEEALWEPGKHDTIYAWAAPD